MKIHLVPTWEDVHKYYEKDGRLCSGCQFNNTWEERQPYGEGYAVEYLQECTIEEQNGTCPSDCPGACKAVLDDRHEQVQDLRNQLQDSAVSLLDFHNSLFASGAKERPKETVALLDQLCSTVEGLDEWLKTNE